MVIYVGLFCSECQWPNAHGRKTRPGMSDFLSVCMCEQWRGVSDNDVSRPAADYALPVTSPAATLAACQ